jgi:hypothetical protein
MSVSVPGWEAWQGFLRKPGALPGAAVLDQARAAGRFTPVHDAWWAAARAAHGDAAGTRALVEVLLLHRRMTHDHVVAGIAAALRAGAMTPLRPLPDGVTDLDYFRVRRHDRAGGVIHEYRLVA